MLLWPSSLEIPMGAPAASVTAANECLIAGAHTRRRRVLRFTIPPSGAGKTSLCRSIGLTAGHQWEVP